MITSRDEDLIANLRSIVKELIGECGYEKTHIARLVADIIVNLVEEDE